jgi:hypothetical protein
MVQSRVVERSAMSVFGILMMFNVFHSRVLEFPWIVAANLLKIEVVTLTKAYQGPLHHS